MKGTEEAFWLDCLPRKWAGSGSKCGKQATEFRPLDSLFLCGIFNSNLPDWLPLQLQSISSPKWLLSAFLPLGFAWVGVVAAVLQYNYLWARGELAIDLAFHWQSWSLAQKGARRRAGEEKWWVARWFVRKGGGRRDRLCFQIEQTLLNGADMWIRQNQQSDITGRDNNELLHDRFP